MRLTIGRVTSSIAASVEGADLPRDLPSPVREQIAQALWQYGVAVFRNQPAGP
jgi:alpha-ketoglutarate-dependent taurine dioxygenase